MGVEAFVSSYTEPDSLRIRFNWNGKHADELRDLNRDYRREVYRFFQAHKGAVPLQLIHDMYKAEIKYGRNSPEENSSVIADLVQELLSRGGVEYLDDYIEGLMGSQRLILRSG